MSVPSHGYSLRPRTTPHSSTSSSSPSSHTTSSTTQTTLPSTQSSTLSSTLSVPQTKPPPVSPTKRKLVDASICSDDEDDYDAYHIGSDKLHEFHKVKISSRTESDVREAKTENKQPSPIQLEPYLPPSSSPPSLFQPSSPPLLQPTTSTITHSASTLQLQQPITTTTTTTTSTQQQSEIQSQQQSTQKRPTTPPTLVYAPSSWGYITSRGGRKENQDFYIVPQEEMIDVKNPNTALMFGVFDGHGIKGLEAARECGRCIHAHFAASSRAAAAQTQQDGAKTQEWVDHTLHDAFRQAQQSLLQIEAKHKQVLDYGTTACVAVIRPALHEMTIAWVGDARAAVVRWENVVSTPRISAEDLESTGSASGGSGMSEKASTFIYNSSGNLIPNTNNNNNNNNENSNNTAVSSSGGVTRTGSKGSNHEDGACSPFLNCESAPGSPASSTTTIDDNSSVQPTLQVVELTSDHVPQREDERARVLQQGGVIRRVGNVVRVVAGGNFTEEQLKQQRLALNITRSLGHAILSQYGISSEPDILRTAIQSDDILIIASDGLWNELSSSEISAIALECKMAGFSPQKFCNMLLRRAEVVSKLKGVLSDNITIVVYHHVVS